MAQQQTGMQSPAYKECSELAATNPAQALAKADAWLKIDNGLAAQHCRALALYGLKRYAEAGDALASLRDIIPANEISLRSYVTRQAAHAYLNANAADKALNLLGTELIELGNYRGDNANGAKITAELLLDRARIDVTYGKLPDAAKDLDHAVSLTPVNVEVLLERAGVFEKLGDMPLAKADLNAVLTIDSGNTSAHAMLNRLNNTSTSANVIAPAAVVAAPAVAASAPNVTTSAPNLQTPANAVDAANAAPVTPVSSANTAPPFASAQAIAKAISAKKSANRFSSDSQAP